MEADLQSAFEQKPFGEARKYFHKKMGAQLQACLEKVAALEADPIQQAEVASGPAATAKSVFNLDIYDNLMPHVQRLLQVRSHQCIDP